MWRKGKHCVIWIEMKLHKNVLIHRFECIYNLYFFKIKCIFITIKRDSKRITYEGIIFIWNKGTSKWGFSSSFINFSWQIILVTIGGRTFLIYQDYSPHNYNHNYSYNNVMNCFYI